MAENYVYCNDFNWSLTTKLLNYATHFALKNCIDRMLFAIYDSQTFLLLIEIAYHAIYDMIGKMDKNRYRNSIVDLMNLLFLFYPLRVDCFLLTRKLRVHSGLGININKGIPLPNAWVDAVQNLSFAIPKEKAVSL